MRFHGNEEKTGVGSWKKYALQAILLPFVLFQKCFKQSIIALFDHTENVVGTKFQN